VIPWPRADAQNVRFSFRRASLERAHAVAPGIVRALLVEALPAVWRMQKRRWCCAAIRACGVAEASQSANRGSIAFRLAVKRDWHNTRPVRACDGFERVSRQGS